MVSSAILSTTSGCSPVVGRLLWEQERECSIHSTPTNSSRLFYLRRLAQSGSAFALGAKGQRFESFISDQFAGPAGMCSSPLTEVLVHMQIVRQSVVRRLTSGGPPNRITIRTPW